MCDFALFHAQTQERDEYKRTHIWPYIEQFLRSGGSHGTYCVMLFAAYLPQLHCYYQQVEPEGHPLFMQHMQRLCTVLGTHQPNDLFCNTLVLELQLLRRGIDAGRQDEIDHRVLERGRRIRMRVKRVFFCLFLDFIVTRLDACLRQHADEWRATVVRGCFDNTQKGYQDREFLARAEAFFQRYGFEALRRQALGWYPDETWLAAASAGSAQHASLNVQHASLTVRNPYVI